MTTMRLLQTGIGLLVSALVLLAGATLGGQVGLVAASVALAGAALVTLRRGLRERPPPLTPRASAGDPLGPFSTYRSIRFTLGYATNSGWAYDRAVRPLLTRLAASVLAHRRDIDLHLDSQRAQTLLGPDACYFIDPAPPPSTGRDDTGVSLTEIGRFVDRLEEL